MRRRMTARVGLLGAAALAAAFLSAPNAMAGDPSSAEYFISYGGQTCDAQMYHVTNNNGYAVATTSKNFGDCSQSYTEVYYPVYGVGSAYGYFNGTAVSSIQAHVAGSAHQACMNNGHCGVFQGLS
jgi:hypothetical protein